MVLLLLSFGNSNCNGKIAFLDNNKREVESIQMRHSHNGEWMTTNQVLVATQANHHIVRAVNWRSERIKNQQVATNVAIQRQEDKIELSQQRLNSWTSLNPQAIDQMVNNNQIPPIETTTAPAPTFTTNASPTKK